MMEESEKRRERLKAMRMEAARAGDNAYSDSLGLASGGLSNPLNESSSTSAPIQYASSRFDYYTDPMSAFSGSKRRNNITPQVSQGYYNTPPRPVHQGMTTSPVYHRPGVNSPGERTQQAPGAHYHHSPLGSPFEVVTPLDSSQGNHPHAWGGSGGAFYHSSSPNFSRDGRFSNTGFGQGHSPCVSYGRGRGQRYNSSHYDSGRGANRYIDSGRGRGRSLGNMMNPGSGLSGRRGASSHESVSAEQRPDLYYRKEMVEDPWELLTPIIWKDVPTQDSDKSWLPKSISMKKAKVSAEALQTSYSQRSLAEYLAASFNDSSNEAVDDEQHT